MRGGRCKSTVQNLLLEYPPLGKAWSNKVPLKLARRAVCCVRDTCVLECVIRFCLHPVPAVARAAAATGTRGVSRRLSQRMCPEMFSKARSRGMGSSEEGEGEGEGSHLMDDHEKPPSRRTSLPRAVPVAGLAVLVLVAWFSYGGSVRGPGLASRDTRQAQLSTGWCVMSRSHACRLAP